MRSAQESATQLRVEPLHPVIGALASGVDLAQPLDDATIRAIDAAMNRHAVLVFRGQRLTGEQQMAFANRFGPLDPGLNKMRKTVHRFAYDALIDISNVDVDGSVAARDSRKVVSNFANQLWHSDSSFQRPKAHFSMLHAVVVPEAGGETEFADLRAAHDALSEAERAELAGLRAEHWALHSRFMLGDTQYTPEQQALFAPVQWPLIQTHPGSGRKLLFVGIHARAIVGWPVAEGRMRLLDLLEHATQRAFVFRHSWQVGDLVIWDNRCTLHRGRRFDLSQRRELRRTTINDLDSLTF